MNANDLEKQLTDMSKKLLDLQKMVIQLQKLVITIGQQKNKGTSIVQKPVIVGVKDITTAQLYHGYKKGMNMQELWEYADGKYTADQIRKKLEKLGAE